MVLWLLKWVSTELVERVGIHVSVSGLIVSGLRICILYDLRYQITGKYGTAVYTG